MVNVGTYTVRPMDCLGTVSPKKTRAKEGTHVTVVRVPSKNLKDHMLRFRTCARRHCSSDDFGSWFEINKMMSLWFKKCWKTFGVGKKNAPPLEFMKKNLGFVRAIHPQNRKLMVQKSGIHQLMVGSWNPMIYRALYIPNVSTWSRDDLSQARLLKDPLCGWDWTATADITATILRYAVDVGWRGVTRVTCDRHHRHRVWYHSFLLSWGVLRLLVFEFYRVKLNDSDDMYYSNLKMSKKRHVKRVIEYRINSPKDLNIRIRYRNEYEITFTQIGLPLPSTHLMDVVQRVR